MTGDALTLHGYEYSVYTRSVRMALYLKGIPYSYVEVDPFEDAGQIDLAALTPFGRVPVLTHGGFQLYETQAILGYVDAMPQGATLTPDGPAAQARMRQVMGIVDSYVYWPLVRQVVSNVVFAPLTGGMHHPEDVAKGMAAAPGILGALEDIAEEGLVLAPSTLCLADCLLWPMMDYIRMVPDLVAELANCPALEAWVIAMSDYPAALETVPDLEALAGGTHV